MSPSEIATVPRVGVGNIRVIVVHGWIADHTLFEPFIRLIDHNRFAYAFLDCRGYGRRRDSAGPFSIATIADDVRALADQLGWSRFHVIGHSMGGMAAQRLMIDVPERLVSVILLAPVPASGALLSATRRAMLIKALADPEARRALIEANTGGTRPAAWIDAILQLSLRSTRPDALAGYLESWSTTDFSSQVREVSFPLRLIVGELDPGAPLHRMQETILHWHSRAAFQCLAGVGHYPMQEEPDDLYASIEQHLLCSDRGAGQDFEVPK